MMMNINKKKKYIQITDLNTRKKKDINYLIY